MARGARPGGEKGGEPDGVHFDREGFRRPPPPMEPVATCPPDVVERYRRAAVEWRTGEVPPIEVALWLTKPAGQVRGTWREPAEAADWLGGQLASYAPRFASAQDRDGERLARWVGAAADRLARGLDVVHGVYLGRPLFLSLGVVTCSPNRARNELPCPLRRPGATGVPGPSAAEEIRAVV
ncbi:hypothetical protein OG422_13450 [Streptomyces sp. NBC_01525]|uniref:Uncharacterized protein n=1 Tax=Streptomyces benahoarensis TaxID=2595054 RepID=A0A553Z464_9ACTN|nr:hypothetical protein [Streptomyces benahoarensis]TSB19409.1 hypothetical protein FNJ62_22490 [Streptomyces benahoarensis]TSB36063.1 hypothetical protein FNZ23_20175 [Streptomyces benahoarensis]